MALPKLNNAPKYSMVIPSTNKKISYRPFLVKEEKILMIALESQDAEMMNKAMIDIIEACIDESVNVNALTTYDIEQIFLKLRTKSVGENTTIGLECENCKHKNEIDVNLDDITILVEKNEELIKLNDQYTLKMVHPTFERLNKISKNEYSTETERLFDIFGASMDAILTEDEKIDLKDESDEEIRTFIESLNNEQFKMVQKFIESIPTLKKDIEFNCSECGHENKITIEGMNNFF